MLIEFACPVCRAQLSVDSNLAGGQLDCPKCQELIIIPLSPPGLDPSKTARVSDLLNRENVDEAIIRAVKPYREELIAKRNQLLQAIEEIKLRNERIRELETNGLQVQKELWALEADFEERKDDFRRAREEILELKKKFNKVTGKLSSSAIRELGVEMDDLRGSEELREELKKLQDKSGESEARLQAEIATLKDEVARARGGQGPAPTLEQSQDRLVLLEAEIAKVRDQAEFLQHAVAEYQQHTTRATLLLAQALGQHDDLRKEREALRKDLTGLREQFQALDALSELGARLTAGVAKLDKAARKPRASAALADLRQQMEALEAAGRKSGEQARLDAAERAKLESALAEARKQVDVLEAASRKSGDQNRLDAAERAKLESALAGLRKQVEALEAGGRKSAEQARLDAAERAKLESALAEARKAGEEASRRAAELEDLRRRLKEEEAARQHLQEAVGRHAAELQGRDAKLKAALDEQAALHRRIQELDRERAALDQAGVGARARLAELEKIAKQTDADLAQYKALVARNEDTLRKAADERSQIAARAETAEKKAAQNEGLQKLLLETQAALASERKMGLEALLQEKRQSEAALAAAKASGAQGAEMIGQLREKLNKAELELEEARRGGKTDAERIRALEAARADAEKRLAEQTAKLDAADKARQAERADAEKRLAEQAAKLETAEKARLAEQATLRQQLEQAAKERDRIQMEVEQARRSAQDLTNRAETLATAQSQAAQERGQLEERILQLTRDLQAEREAAARLRQEAEAGQKKTGALEEENRRQSGLLAEERKKGESAVAELRQAAETLAEESEAERRRLTRQVAMLEETQETLHRRAENLGAEKTALEQRMQAVTAELADWRTKADRSAADLAGLERTRAELARETQKLREEADSLRVKSGQLGEQELRRRAELETQIARQNQALETGLREMELLKSRLNTASREQEMTADNLERREKAYGDLLRENQNLSKRIDRLTAELSAQQQAAEKSLREIHRLDLELRRSHDRVKKLEEGDVESGMNLETVNALRQKVTESEVVIRSLQDRAKSLENKIEFDQSLGERLLRSEERNRQLAGRLADMETSVKEQELLAKKLQARADRVEGLESESRKAAVAVSTLEEQLKIARMELEREQARGAQEQQRREGESEAQSAALREEIARLRDEAARLRDDVRRRDEDLISLSRTKEEATRSTRDSEAAMRRVAELERELEQARQTSLAQTRGDSPAAQAAAGPGAGEDRISSLEIQVRDLTTENARLKNTMRTLSENLKAQWRKRSSNIHG